jgi:hypothetical protein
MISNQSAWRTRLTVVGLCVTLAACGWNVESPTTNQSIPAGPTGTADVAIRVDAGNDLRNVTVEFNGADVTGSLVSPSIGAGDIYTATLPGVAITPAAATHSMVIRGEIYQGLYWSGTRTDPITFRVTAAAAPVLNLGPPVTMKMLDEAPISVTRSATTGALAVTLTSSGPAVTVAPPSVTIPDTQATGAFALTAVAEGTSTLTAAAPGFTGATTTATVTPLLVFRARDNGVEAYRAIAGGTLQNNGQVGAGASSGTHFVVGLAFNGTDRLFRASATGLESILINANGTLGSPTFVSADPTSNGVAVAAAGDLVIRTTDTTLGLFRVSGNSVAHVGNAPTVDVSAGGIAADFMSGIAVRAHESGVEAISATSSAFGGQTVKYTSTATATTGRGVGVDLYLSGTDLKGVRAWESGLELFSIQRAAGTGALTGITAGNRVGANVSAGGVAVAVTADGRRAVRTGDTTIELFNIEGATPARLNDLGAPAANSGVALAIVGRHVFRASDTGLQVFRINPAMDRLEVVTTNAPSGAGASSMGVGIAVK